MRITISLFLLLTATLWLASCSKQKEGPATATGKQTSTQDKKASPATASEKSDYQEIEWTDLMPKDDLEALMNPPEYLGEIADGSEEDALDDRFKNPQNNPDEPYQKALTSTRIIPEFHQRKIRLPGFIVPLDFDDHQIITTFLLVPFFGACIHLPPPPPNQIIFATYEPGLPLDDLSDAFFMEGTLFAELKEHDLATSAYSMTVDRILPYEE